MQTFPIQPKTEQEPRKEIKTGRGQPETDGYGEIKADKEQTEQAVDHIPKPLHPKNTADAGDNIIDRPSRRAEQNADQEAIE